MVLLINDCFDVMNCRRINNSIKEKKWRDVDKPVIITKVKTIKLFFSIQRNFYIYIET